MDYNEFLTTLVEIVVEVEDNENFGDALAIAKELVKNEIES